MNKSITSPDIIGFEKKDLNIYSMFQDVIEKLYNIHYLTDSDIKRIYSQRLSVLQYKLKLYTKDESSSVLYETAEYMLKNIDYTLSVFLNNLPDIQSIASNLKELDIKYMTEKGYKLIQNYLNEGGVLLNKIAETKVDIRNIAYQDTIDYGLPTFFKKYNPYFKPMETDADIDYLIKDKNIQYEGCGIIYVTRYMKHLYLENKFLKCFDAKAINILLKSYDIRYNELLINIFTIVLTTAVGLVICGLNPQNLCLTTNNINYIKNKFYNMTKDELFKTIHNSILICSLILKINDNEVIDYMLKSTKDITDDVCNALSLNKLDSVFTVIKDENIIIYKDHKNLSSEKFKKITDELYNCSKIQDKIDIMTESIKSLYDMIDILESDCFLETEFEEYYKSLDFIVIALIYKHMDEYDLKYDKECYKYLIAFIQKNNLKDKIEKIKDKIIFD